ncbi:hypothetical protein GCM10027030_30330 [Luteococcus sediminum]
MHFDGSRAAPKEVRTTLPEGLGAELLVGESDAEGMGDADGVDDAVVTDEVAEGTGVLVRLGSGSWGAWGVSGAQAVAPSTTSARASRVLADIVVLLRREALRQARGPGLGLGDRVEFRGSGCGRGPGEVLRGFWNLMVC